MPKQRILFLFALLALTATLCAQVPQAINYQAVIRTDSDQPVDDPSLSIRVQIRQGSPTGAIAFAEIHADESAANGGVQFALGSANSADFVALDWAAGPYFIQIDYDLDNGTAFSNTDAVQLLAVPYALYAEQARSSGDWVNVGDTVLFARTKRVAVGELANVNLNHLSDGISMSNNIRLGPRIHPGGNGTENGYSLVHFKNGTTQHGGIIRASQGDEDGGNAPLLYQASRHVMDGSAIGTPFANGNILGMSTSAGQGALVFGILNNNGDAYIQSAKVGAPSTLVLNPEGGMVEVPCMRVLGGCDWYELSQSTDEIQPGEVAIIAPAGGNNAVQRSTRAYDPLVTGVVSGAGGIQPGLGLTQAGALEGNTKIAMGGKVMVRVVGKVAPGNLLTSSDQPGRAMAVKNRRKAFGTVLGKALTAPNAEGLVLMQVMMR